MKKIKITWDPTTTIEIEVSEILETIKTLCTENPENEEVLKANDIISQGMDDISILEATCFLFIFLGDLGIQGKYWNVRNRTSLEMV